MLFRSLKGPRSAIERQIRKGNLGPGSQASPSKHGTYRRLDEIPEFQHALRGAAAGARSSSAPVAALLSTPTSTAAATRKGVDFSKPWIWAAAAVLLASAGLLYLIF